MTYTEILPLLEKLRQLDEIVLLELLEITTEDLVDTFIDRILENQDKFYHLYAEE
jgi:hypothetical protein